MAARKEKKEIRATCAKCGPNRVAYVLASHVEEDTDDVVQFWNDYRVIRCGGCKHIQFQIAHTNSEDLEYEEGPDGQPYVTPNATYTYWPPLAQRPKPEWFNAVGLHDRLLGEILGETYRALDNDMPIAAAITMRTAFDRVTELLKIDPGLSFAKKLQALVDKGEIAVRDKAVLDPLVEAGNAAAHRAWTPNAEELTTMLLILEALVHRAFVLSKRVRALKRRTPKRKGKQLQKQ